MACPHCLICGESSQCYDRNRKESVSELQNNRGDGEELESPTPPPPPSACSKISAVASSKQPPNLSFFQIIHLEICDSCKHLSTRIPDLGFHDDIPDELRTVEFCLTCISELDQFHKLVEHLETLESQIRGIRDNVLAKCRARLEESPSSIGEMQCSHTCFKILKRIGQQNTHRTSAPMGYNNAEEANLLDQSLVVKVEIEPHEDIATEVARMTPHVKLARMNAETLRNYNQISKVSKFQAKYEISEGISENRHFAGEAVPADKRSMDFEVGGGGTNSKRLHKPSIRITEDDITDRDYSPSPDLRDLDDESEFSRVKHPGFQSNQKGKGQRRSFDQLKSRATVKRKGVHRNIKGACNTNNGLRDAEKIGDADAGSSYDNSKVPADQSQETQLSLETPTNFACDQCGASYSRKTSLNQHVRTIHLQVKIVVCDLCGKELSCKQSLIGHQFTHHAKELNLTGFKCDQCGKVLASSETLSHHIKTLHEKKYRFECPCEGCPFKAFHMAKIRIHLQTHTNEKNYVCAICGHAVRRKHDFNIHMRMHTGEKPFVCGECGKAYARKDKLSIHEKRHKPDRPHVCELCGLKYPTRTNLMGHFRSHHIAKGVGAGIRPKRKSKYEDPDPLESKVQLNVIQTQT